MTKEEQWDKLGYVVKAASPAAAAAAAERMFIDSGTYQ